MKKHINVVLLILVAFASVIAKTTDTLEVKVYYETQTLRCDKFITDQLHPTYMAVNNFKAGYHFSPENRYNTYLTVKLVPYGNAFKLTQLENGTWQLACKEWGHTSCAYNKHHACAVALGPSPWTTLNYIASMVASDYASPVSSARSTCFEDTHMSTCVNSVDGDDLLIGHGLDTMALEVKLDDLPLVTFDGVYDLGEQRAARENLLAVVCQKLGNVPAVCASPRANRIMAHSNFGTAIYYPRRTLCQY